METALLEKPLGEDLSIETPESEQPEHPIFSGSFADHLKDFEGHVGTSKTDHRQEMSDEILQELYDHAVDTGKENLQCKFLVESVHQSRALVDRKKELEAKQAKNVEEALEQAQIDRKIEEHIAATFILAHLVDLPGITASDSDGETKTTEQKNDGAQETSDPIANTSVFSTESAVMNNHLDSLIRANNNGHALGSDSQTEAIVTDPEPTDKKESDWRTEMDQQLEKTRLKLREQAVSDEEKAKADVNKLHDEALENIEKKIDSLSSGEAMPTLPPLSDTEKLKNASGGPAIPGMGNMQALQNSIEMRRSAAALGAMLPGETKPFDMQPDQSVNQTEDTSQEGLKGEDYVKDRFTSLLNTINAGYTDSATETQQGQAEAAFTDLEKLLRTIPEGRDIFASSDEVKENKKIFGLFPVKKSSPGREPTREELQQAVAKIEQATGLQLPQTVISKAEQNRDWKKIIVGAGLVALTVFGTVNQPQEIVSTADSTADTTPDSGLVSTGFEKGPGPDVSFSAPENTQTEEGIDVNKSVLSDSEQTGTKAFGGSPTEGTASELSAQQEENTVSEEDPIQRAFSDVTMEIPAGGNREQAIADWLRSQGVETTLAAAIAADLDAKINAVNGDNQVKEGTYRFIDDVRLLPEDQQQESLKSVTDALNSVQQPTS